MGDRYNPLFELGAGSFGKAWVVRDNKTQKKYVSKVIQVVIVTLTLHNY